MYRNILGINSLEPGYTKVEICPDFSCGLNAAQGYYDSIHGRITVGWKKEADGKIYVKTQIPANVEAVIRVGDVEKNVGSGVYEFSVIYEEI